jgi:hypothetical protein
MISDNVRFAGKSVVSNGGVDLQDPILVLLLHSDGLRNGPEEHAGETVCLGFKPSRVLQARPLVTGVLTKGVCGDQNAGSALQGVAKLMCHHDVGRPLVLSRGRQSLG